MKKHEPSVPQPTILVVDDEAPVRQFLRLGLTGHGYRVLEASTGEEALQMASAHVPDAILLDLGLPDLDGVRIAERVRAWGRMPIIVLSARGQEEQKVAALDAGADDYLTKPFGFEELLARLRATLRRATRPTGQPGSVYAAGPLRVDLEGRHVAVDGHEVHLSRIEYNLLVVLIQHAGRVVTHRQLLEAVWGPHSRQMQYLRVYMTHLRRKLEPDPLRPQLFETEIGVGYRLRSNESEG